MLDNSSNTRAIVSGGVVSLLLATASAWGQFYPQSPAVGQTAASTPGEPAARPALSDHARQMLEDAELCDVAFVSTQQGWAVGERGVIWYTADGGRTWQLQPSGVDCRLHSVHFVDAQNGWAAGGYVHPYTHRTTGVVLRTRDGGKRWTATPDATLPLVRRVKFVSQASGWLVADPSPLYPSGVFFSRDAGKSWQPVPGEAPGRWLCGDFRDEQGGAIAASDGMMHVATARGFLGSKSPQLGLRAVRDVAFDIRHGGVSVGDGGVVLMTSDAGVSWQPPRGQLPPAARSEFDYCGAAIIGQRVWAVGAPGTNVLHSPDGGQTWQMQPTGQSLPLLSVTFCDAQHGWAVGAMGTILATRDGGRTWLKQHSGGTRAAVMIVVADVADAPLELIARLAGEEGYLTVVEAMGRRDVDSPRDYAALASDRLQQATVAVGGSGARQAWQFPLREREMPMSAEQIIANWNTTLDGDAPRRLHERLTRRIRQWQPEVIITPSTGSGARAEDVILQRATLAAVEAAATTSAFAEQISAAKLSPWKTKKVFALAAESEADDITLSSARLALHSGRSLGDAAARWQGLLATDFEPRPIATGYRLTTHDVAADVARRDFFAGLSVNPGGEARRRFSDSPATGADFVRDQAQRQRHVERLLAASDAGAISDAAWLAQIEALTANLPPDGAARAIYQLALRYEQSGRVALADDALAMLGERFRDAAEGEAALRQLFFGCISAEQAWRLKQHTAGEVQPATAIGSVEGGEVVGTSGVSSVEKLVVQRCQRAVMLHKAMEKSRPALATDPSLQLALAAALRTTGENRGADAIYRRLAAGDERGAWVGCARTELWLEKMRGTCPRPRVRCKLDAQRPFLDGRLDDTVWQNAAPLTLESRYADDRAWPAVAMIACDGEFLYVAATCRRAGVTVASAESHEEELAQHDRVELYLDVNRDWQSTFKLVVDCDGETGDSCAGDASWDPQWFVAAQGDETSWSVEVAIPLEALGHEAKKNDAWAIGLQRVAPGAGVQSWSQPAGAKFLPQGMGVMLFE